jgi:hypothetical protein
MKVRELLDDFAAKLEAERARAATKGWDAPVSLANGRLCATAGNLSLYEFESAQAPTLAEDWPVTIVPPDEEEPTEGIVLEYRGSRLLVQTFDALGQVVPSATLVPDASGFLQTAARRLADMATKTETYTLGAAERLLPWLAPSQAANGQIPLPTTSASVLSTIWTEDVTARRQRLAAQAVELVRMNKRLLLVSPSHDAADQVFGLIAKAMKGAGLPYRSHLCRYELPLEREVAGIALQELGFEAQVHQFYAKSRAEKAALRKKYERFRELSPLLAHKAQKQRDLDEVKLLEWRLLTQLTELQDKIKEIDTTVSAYESLPIWKRLTMQAVGKNLESLAEYRRLYEQQAQGLRREIDVAKRRIEELAPEAAVPKDLRPEFEELKAEVKRLGGAKKIRELLAAEEGTNRQAFIQNRRLVATTAARVVSDPLFARVRFDVLLADEAPWIPGAFLIAAAGLVRERIILSGDTRDIATAGCWTVSGDAIRWGRQVQPASA